MTCTLSFKSMLTRAPCMPMLACVPCVSMVAMHAAMPTGVRTEQEEVEVEVIRRLVESYFGIVRRNLSDGVPKVRGWGVWGCSSSSSSMHVVAGVCSLAGFEKPFNQCSRKNRMKSLFLLAECQAMSLPAPMCAAAWLSSTTQLP